MPVQLPPILRVTGRLEELVSRNESSFSILREDKTVSLIYCVHIIYIDAAAKLFSHSVLKIDVQEPIFPTLDDNRTPFLHTSTISRVLSILVVGSPFTRRRSAFSPGAILPRSPRRKRLALTEVADRSASTGERPHRFTYKDSSW